MVASRLLVTTFFLFSAFAVKANNLSIIDRRCEPVTSEGKRVEATVCWIPFAVLLARTEELKGLQILIQGYAMHFGSGILIYANKLSYESGTLFESIYVSKMSDKALYKKMVELTPGQVRLIVEPLPFDDPPIEAWTGVRLLEEPQCAPSMRHLKLARALRETGPCDSR